ncbi:MAG: VOC family protein [Vicinamibacterales bacterium]|nr:VOC family protein [Vicinamibacterales bacterium]
MTDAMLEIDTIHHVAVAVSDLVRAKEFYANVLGLKEIPRPAFSFDGAWYSVGSRDLHLIVADDPTFREGKGLNSQDSHFAIRVKSFRRALEYLEAKGYHPQHEDPLRSIRLRIKGPTGFPQIYIMDPDRNVIEINAEADDGDGPEVK